MSLYFKSYMTSSKWCLFTKKKTIGISLFFSLKINLILRFMQQRLGGTLTGSISLVVNIYLTGSKYLPNCLGVKYYNCKFNTTKKITLIYVDRLFKQIYYEVHIHTIYIEYTYNKLRLNFN